MSYRKYKTGSGWAVWRWTRDIENGYLTRLHLIKTPWFSVCMHWINAPDDEPWLHDHPVSFLSLVLRGGYIELRRIGSRRVARCHIVDVFNLVKASPHDRHRIISVLPRTVTLCLMGPKVREWGFHTPNGWMHWKDYYLSP